ncbi:MAG: hypothetical protein AAB497_00335 [Patescibacteria group bacterium]
MAPPLNGNLKQNLRQPYLFGEFLSSFGAGLYLGNYVSGGIFEIVKKQAQGQFLTAKHQVGFVNGCPIIPL